MPRELILGTPPQVRIIHRAAKINSSGDVSALCFSRPRAIDMKRASWVLRDETVTCPRCLSLIAKSVHQ